MSGRTHWIAGIASLMLILCLVTLHEGHLGGETVCVCGASLYLGTMAAGWLREHFKNRS